MGARMANYAALSKGIPSSSNTSTIVNSVEVPYFELKEDPSFWMEHNVQVLIRIRPLNSMERSSFGFSRCLKQENAQSITWIGQPETRFMFDHVACEGIDQETLFRMVGLPMVENCLSGYNSCMFAYGQTGSGKTYTMLGDIDDLEVKPSLNRGMTPRIFEFLFARIRAEEESRRDEQLKYNCKCSFLEIYNEQITDLLDPSSTNLMVREDMKKGVYVENLSEFEVHTVGDILQLLTQGSSNRKVAATNMNRESSRSHCVFTCVIESMWEKDSATNFRFARLNLVDLAGSERQKSSGAEGERLKEAANINKSLSTLGHVIMVLVDVAHGKPRHVPYRDSRLTFLLQDSLGGNSKTMIIANVSPSICSAAETLSTLKFAQRAKLIQNNAIINEDSSGDVVVLKHQIQLLKEELSALKRERINRSLSFSPAVELDTRNKDAHGFYGGEIAQEHMGNMIGKESEGVLRVSCKQLKSLETTLAGSLRREKMAENSVTQLEAEIELLNRLVSQREEDTRCTKMMLKFREDKIQRMESHRGGLMSADDYLREENNALTEEIQLLRSRVDKNPEVTRFAAENFRLLDQVRRFQDFYGEGERDMLMKEVTELRNQLMLFLDGNLKHSNHLAVKDSNLSNSNGLLNEELQRTLSELEQSKNKLNCCLEENAKLRRDLEELHASSNDDITYAQEHDCSAEVIKESIVEVPFSTDLATPTTQRELEGTCGNLRKCVENLMDLQLELDILKIILQEERSYHSEQEELAKSLYQELQLAKEITTSVTKDYEKFQDCNINDHNLGSEITLQSATGRDSTVILLKKEIECALQSLQELQAQMDKMQSEKEEILASEKCSRKSIKSMINQTVVLRDAIDNFEGVLELQVSALNGKISKMEEAVQESLDSWFEQRELLETELDDAKVVASQKTIEAACLLNKFEEIQDTMKEADIMINELMISNETLKLNAHDTRVKEKELKSERISLINEVQSLKLSNCLKDQNYGELEKRYDSDFIIMKRMISELEDVISEVQTTSMEEWMIVASDVLNMKCQIHESTESMRKLLEEVWSEIIAKDCAVSVLHLCHMGTLLETANGLNAENGLLHHGLCESNSVISELQEHNLRSRRELEICRVLKGKLLADIKSGFDRISSKVDETGEVTLKLTSFKKKIQDLQYQEEVMLQRSNDIGSELAMLMKELDHSNKQALASILDQERLLREKDELFRYQEENFMLDLIAKDFESFVLSAELKQLCLLKTETENTFVRTLEVLENFKKEIVFKSLDAASCELILHDEESRLEKLVADCKMKESAIEMSRSHISELHQQIQNLQNDTCLFETESQRLQIDLERKDEELGRLSCLEEENESLWLRLNNEKAAYQVLHQELEDKKAEFEASARSTHNVDVENQKLQDNISFLEDGISKLEDDLRLQRMENKNLELSQAAIQEDLSLRIQDLGRLLGEVNALKEENTCLRNELSLKEINEYEYLNALNLRCLKNIDILKGLLFDMSLLQESASNSQDQKDE